MIESPSGVGKTQATRIFQQPFYAAHKLANSQLPPDMVAPSLFTSNATPEALENSLIGTKGFFRVFLVNKDCSIRYLDFLMVTGGKATMI